MMNINDYIQQQKALLPYCEYRSIKRIPWIECVDGFHASIQGGYGYYSEPNQESNYFVTVEIGYPSETPTEEIKEYAELLGENTDDYTDAIYPQVPIALVDELLQLHGGIKGTYTRGAV
jgi:hypothetical protein